MTDAVKRRGAYAKTAARRREILEAGMEVFSTVGFHGGSIREISERVGISQAGLLHHFSSKSELLAGVLELRDDISREVFSLEPDADGLDMLRGLVRLVEYNATVPGLVSLYCILSAEATSPDHPAHDYFVNRYVSVVTQIASSFDDLKSRGTAPADLDTAGAARRLVALIDGLQVQWLYNPDSVDMAEEVRRHLRTTLPGALLD
ncbi:TetR family transcriptional regulator [Planctomonas psychrotolerans]|uniref:TetR family transcriptional regulator n=1 Tax=Planctomonas psychrotolerans TaxID=2528712 RepID=UPI00123A709A|nr:TetR/AcrR family transcriptional regulator [Planctomonas psychrotolerans]